MRSQNLPEPVIRAGKIPVVAFVLAWALSFPFDASGQGGFGGLGRYQITNVKSGKVLMLHHSDQAKVVQWSAKGTDNEIWEIRSTGDGFYSIRSVLNGTALDVASGQNRTRVCAVNYEGSASQLWRLDRGREVNAPIASRLGMALEITGKRYKESMPAPHRDQLQAQQLRNSPGQPTGSSGQAKTFENGVLRIDYPSSWQAYGQGDAVTITPSGGMVDDGNGHEALVYGLLANVYEPHLDGNGFGRRLQGPGYRQGSGIGVEEATDELVRDLRLSNANMRVVRSHEQIAVNGEYGLSTYLSNDSPGGEGLLETKWLVTLPRPQGLLFFVFTTPEREFLDFESTFRQMLDSVRLSR